MKQIIDGKFGVTKKQLIYIFHETPLAQIKDKYNV